MAEVLYPTDESSINAAYASLNPLTEDSFVTVELDQVTHIEEAINLTGVTHNGFRVTLRTSTPGRKISSHPGAIAIAMRAQDDLITVQDWILGQQSSQILRADGDDFIFERGGVMGDHATQTALNLVGARPDIRNSWLNLWSGNTFGGITINGSATGWKLRNNFIMMQQFSSRVGIWVQNTATGGVFQNNHTVGMIRAGTGRLFEFFGGLPASITMDNNLYGIGGPSGGIRFRVDATDYTTLAAWKSATGLDANSPAEVGYNPTMMQALLLGRDAGAVDADIIDDYNAIARSGTLDIGNVESVGTTPIVHGPYKVKAKETKFKIKLSESI